MNAAMSNDPLPDSIPESEEEQDEEVRIAMEMAMAAAKNPGLTPAQLRELVGKKNKQADIVDQIKKEKEQKAKEEAAKKWTEQKESVFSWISHSIADSTSAIRAAAERVQSSAEQQLYADKIRKDPEVIRLRKKIKHMRKDFKAKRLAGNRVETRHRFKRHRMESNLLSQEEKIEKARKLFVDTNYGLQEYGKAILRAGRKYKNAGTPEEENLEAMLCRNMHQMLSIDKQKAKMKKSNKEVKKYLQRCQSWISDKQALWEMNMMKLDATHTSMKGLYEDTLSRQDKLIQKLKEAEDFKGVDLGDVDVSRFDEIPKNAGPRGMLCALRGLPFSDSIRVSKSSGSSVQNSNSGGRKALYIETYANDAVSVSSHLSDPDADFESSISAETGYGFGDDAPWNLGDSSLSLSKKAEAVALAEASKEQSSMKEGLSQPPSTITTVVTSVEVPAMKPAPSAATTKLVEERPHNTDEEKEPISPAEESASTENENSSPEKSGSPEMDKTGVESIETTPCSTESAED